MSDVLEPKKKSLLKIDAEKESQKLAGQLSEELDATGQESDEQAEKWVIEVNKDRQAKEKQQEDRILQFLTDKDKGKISTYNEALRRLTHNCMSLFVQFPKGWDWQVVESIRGIGVMVRRPDLTIFARGFKPCHTKRYDLNAINTLIMQVENTIEDYERNQGSQDNREATPGTDSASFEVKENPS